FDAELEGGKVIVVAGIAGAVVSDFGGGKLNHGGIPLRGAAAEAIKDEVGHHFGDRVGTHTALSAEPEIDVVEGGEDEERGVGLVDGREVAFVDSLADETAEELLVLVAAGGELGAALVGEVAPFVGVDGGAIEVGGDDADVSDDGVAELAGR